MIEMTESGGQSILSACSQLNIKYTTARNIISWWRKSGRLYRSATDESRQGCHIGNKDQESVPLEEKDTTTVEATSDLGSATVIRPKVIRPAVYAAQTCD